MIWDDLSDLEAAYLADTFGVDGWHIEGGPRDERLGFNDQRGIGTRFEKGHTLSRKYETDEERDEARRAAKRRARKRYREKHPEKVRESKRRWKARKMAREATK